MPAPMWRHPLTAANLQCSDCVNRAAPRMLWPVPRSLGATLRAPLAITLFEPTRNKVSSVCRLRLLNTDRVLASGP